MKDFHFKSNASLPEVEQKEWLVTNGIGGFAMGTVAGMLTRGYHGLLIAALQPPSGRRLLVTRVEETAYYQGEEYSLAVNQWASNAVDTSGLKHLVRFHLEGTIPVWTYALGEALLEKRLWMRHGENTTYLRYTMVEGEEPLTLSATVLFNDRDYHGTTQAGDVSFRVRELIHGLEITSEQSGGSVFLLSPDMEVRPQDYWQEEYFLAIEKFRGLADVDAHWCGATLKTSIRRGESRSVTMSTEPEAALNTEKASVEEMERQRQLITRAGDYSGWDPPESIAGSKASLDEVARQLIVGADQFIVRRGTKKNPRGQTVIAGYPWFGDWGRDTMIALPGLTLVTGRLDAASEILRTFAHFMDRGMLPNRFPDDGEEPVYNTADATLWYFEALGAHFRRSGDLEFVKELYPVLAEIIERHVEGTRFHIHLDPSDNLIYAGEPGVQLTWMDAKAGDWVVTPRVGKPVEINALWYNALKLMTQFAEMLSIDSEIWAGLARKTARGFQRFWNQELGFCLDVLDGPEGSDPALRPNQLLAVSLHHSPLMADQQKAVVDICEHRLLTPYGLRSLAFDHPSYQGRYGGGVVERDGAYHQGTVWSWLIGPFVTAHFRVYGDRGRAWRFLEPLLDHVWDYGIGSVSEIFDGDPPHQARGCPAQAWGVAEVLRVMELLGKGDGYQADMVSR